MYTDMSHMLIDFAMAAVLLVAGIMSLVYKHKLKTLRENADIVTFDNRSRLCAEINTEPDSDKRVKLVNAFERVPYEKHAVELYKGNDPWDIYPAILNRYTHKVRAECLTMDIINSDSRFEDHYSKQ